MLYDIPVGLVIDGKKGAKHMSFPISWIIGLISLLVFSGGVAYEKHSYDQGKIDIGKADQLKVDQPKIDNLNHDLDNCKTSYGVLTDISAKQTAQIKQLGVQALAAKKAYLQAIKTHAPIVSAAEKKKTSVGSVNASPEAIKGDCEAQLSDLHKLLGGVR